MLLEKTPKKETFTRIDFKDLLVSVHPELEKTPVPKIANRLLCSLKPVCVYQNDDTSLPACDAYFRGSLIKRHVLSTPKGYLEIPHFFQNYKLQLDSQDQSLTLAVTGKLAHKPMEIDFRAEFNNPQQILPTLTQSLQTQGFAPTSRSDNNPLLFKKENLTVSIRAIEIGTDDYPRTLYNVEFIDKAQTVLNIDVADLPDESKFSKEMRTSAESSFFELITMSPAQIKDDKITILISNSLKDYPKYDGVRIFSQHAYTNTIGNGLRGLSDLVFWPKKDTYGNFDINFILSQLDKGYMRKPHSRIQKNSLLNLDPEELDLLQKRADSLISDFLLYFTFDPFLFTVLGFESGLFEFIPLGKYLQSQEDVNKLLTFMKKELTGQSGIQMEAAYQKIPELSSMYKDMVLLNQNYDLEKTGSFMLLRALNRMLEESGRPKIAESLQEIVNLLNPLAPPTEPHTTSASVASDATSADKSEVVR